MNVKREIDWIKFSNLILAGGTFREVAKDLGVSAPCLARRYKTELDPDTLEVVQKALKTHKGGNRPRRPCGTPGAYSRHLRRGEEPCTPCRKAEADRMLKNRYKYRDHPELIPPHVHGTVKGYRYYMCRDCEPCLKAANLDSMEYRQIARLVMEIWDDDPT